MGEVYRARDEQLSRVVAVKILDPDLAVRPDFRQRFEREAKLLARLNHPHICTIHDVGREQHLDFIVMECLEGESLSTRLRRSSLSVDVTIKYAIQIADALATAHRSGLAHRDLKPSNVFITRHGAKLLDFGIARMVAALPDSNEGRGEQIHTLTTAGAVLGTPGYIAPEVLEGRQADARSDLFSFGALVYEMCSGRPAFKATSAAGVVTAVLFQEPPNLGTLFADIPPQLVALVTQCLAKDPEHRWQSAHDAALTLQTLRDDRHRPSRAVFVPTSVRRLTFNRGTISAARFVPQSRDVVYSAAWESAPVQVFLTRIESPESRPLGFAPADVLAISQSGNLALSLEGEVAGYVRIGVLARVPLAGAEPRRLLSDVMFAEWLPDGESLLVVRRSGFRCFLEWPVGRVVYHTDGLITHPRVARDGSRIAFVDHRHHSDDGGSVRIIESGAPPRVLCEGWQSISGLAWSPDNREVWFTAAEGATPRALRAVTLSGEQRLLAHGTTPLTLHDVAPTGDVLVSQDSFRTTMLFRGDNEAVERDLSYLDMSFPRDLSIDGTTLLFDESGEGGGADYSVYFRRTDGGTPIRLGSGLGSALSPTANCAATLRRDLRALKLIPTGIGRTFEIQASGVDEYRRARWTPDGHNVVFSGEERDAGLRLFKHNISSAETSPISPGGFIGPAAISPDGEHVAAIASESRLTWLFPLQPDSGPPQLLSDLGPSDIPVQWSLDGQALYVRQRGGGMPLHVYRFEIESSSRSLWKSIEISDRAGVHAISDIVLTPDARHYVISYARVLSDLFLMTGVG